MGNDLDKRCETSEARIRAALRVRESGSPVSDGAHLTRRFAAAPGRDLWALAGRRVAFHALGPRNLN